MARGKFDTLSLAPPNTAGTIRALKAFFEDSHAMPKMQKTHIRKQLREIIEERMDVFQTEAEWSRFFRKLPRLDLRRTVLVRKWMRDALNRKFEVNTTDALGVGGNVMVNKQEMQSQGMEREFRSILAMRLPRILKDKKKIIERRNTLALFRRLAIKHARSSPAKIAPAQSNDSPLTTEQPASVGAASEQLEATPASISGSSTIPVRTYPSLAKYYTRIKFVYMDEDGKERGRGHKGLKVPLAQTYALDRRVKPKSSKKVKGSVTNDDEIEDETSEETSEDEGSDDISTVGPQAQVTISSRGLANRPPRRVRQKKAQRDWSLARFVKEKNFAESARVCDDERQDGDGDYAPDTPPKKKARVTRSSTALGSSRSISEG